MNSISRYYLSQHAWKTETLELTGDEAHHCTRVLRSKVGDAVEVFDGAGKSVFGEISELSKEKVLIKITSEVKKSELKSEIHLCQSIPKGGNMELIVQKAVELGVTSIQPLITENTVASISKPEQLKKKQEKWQRIALEACKQCGQNFLPIVHPAVKFSEFVKSPNLQELNLVAALHPQSVPLAEAFPSEHKKASLLIGPEGDFSASEYEQAFELGYQPISLGDIVLRVETATLYCISVLKHELGK